MLARLGCPHAAAMHARGARPEDFSPSDWHFHMDEEEAEFFPRLDSGSRAILTAHHTIFRDELQRFGRVVSLRLVEAHSTMEDALAIQLARSLGIAA